MITNTTYKVGIYLRLSREDENRGESESISNQRAMLLNYIKDHDLEFVTEYVDDGVSGMTFNRKGFNQMIKDCESKKINMVITKDTSRLGRDHIEFGYYVERYFPEHHIRYVAVNDGIDTFANSAMNDMLVFKSAFNDLYIKDISNKLKSSLYTKKRNGQFVGAYAPYGYRKSMQDKHQLLINEEESEIVKRIFKMYSEGYSICFICETLTREGIKTPSISKKMNLGHKNLHYGIWSARTIRDILRCQTYIGNLTQGKQKKVSYKSKKRIRNDEESLIIAKGCVPPIISQNTFELVQGLLKNNNHKGINGNKNTENLLLRGMIYCEECGHLIGFRANEVNTKKRGRVVRIYGNCNYWSKRKKECVCTPHSVKYQDIEEIVLTDLKKICRKNINVKKLYESINKIAKTNSKKQQIKEQIAKCEKKIENNKKKIVSCYNDKLDGIINLEMYEKVQSNLLKEIEKYNEEKLKYTKLLSTNNQTDNEIFYRKRIDDFLEMKTLSKTIITCLIDKITIDEQRNIGIYYKFKI